MEPEQPFRDQADKLQKTETATDVNENKEKNRHILGFKVNAEATAARLLVLLGVSELDFL